MTPTEEFERETLPLLQKVGKDIGEKAKSGDENCKKIILFYGWLHARFEPASYVLLKSELDKYMKGVQK